MLLGLLSNMHHRVEAFYVMWWKGDDDAGNAKRKVFYKQTTGHFVFMCVCFPLAGRPEDCASNERCARFSVFVCLFVLQDTAS